MRCFVIGPIGDQLAAPGTEPRQVYERGLEVLELVIRGACDRLSPPIEAFRADEIDVPGEIPQQVFEALRDEELVIADLTDANPNVMYELGIRHALGRCTIQIGEHNRLPFDISTIRTVQFEHSASGLLQARDRLLRVLNAAVGGNCPPTTAGQIIIGGRAAVASDEPRIPEPIPGLEEDDQDEQAEFTTDASDGDAPGMLEALADSEQSIPELGEKIASLGSLIERVGEIAVQHTPAMTNAASAGAKLAVASRYASDLDPVARQMDRESVELEVLAKSIDQGLDVLFAYLEANPGSIASNRVFLESVVVMATSAKQNADQTLKDLAAVISSQTDMARILRPVLRLLVAALNRTAENFLVLARWGDSAARILALDPPEG